MLASIARLLDDGCDQGVYPGAVLVVFERGQLVHRSFHGVTSFDDGGVELGPQTLFDLASLTKILATTTVCLLAVDRCGLDLYAPVKKYLPHLAEKPLGDVSLSGLLDHTSGLAAWAPFYELVQRQLGTHKLCTIYARDAIRDMVGTQKLAEHPGRKMVYSDLGFILLDMILERVCGDSLDKLFRTMVTEPLGIRDLFFIDLKQPQVADELRAGRSFAATERCPWRKKVLVGEVHDQNTWAAGGVSGQAGLFGTGDSVSALCLEWLRGFVGKSRLLPRELVERFWTRSPRADSSRTLGFDTRALKDSQAGSLMGPKTVGHLGYTGTSAWIDPERELVVVFLTNRVHPSASNESIKRFRPMVHDAVVKAIDGDRI